MRARKAICNKATAFRAVGAAAVRGLTAIPIMALATSSITIDSVQQRWPWNNKVDITYTVTDGASHEGGVYAGVDFTIAIPGYEPVTVPGPSAETGGIGSRQHSFTWTAPSGIKATDVTVTATLFPTNVPLNDYMIIDLATGAVEYERLLASQAASNERYNTDEYKTAKMVLRKVPKWSDANTLPNYSTLAALGGYPTGDDTNHPSENGATVRQPDKDYYIGLFNVTKGQYYRVTGLSKPGASVETQYRDYVHYQEFRAGGERVDLGKLTSNAERMAVLTNKIAGVTSDTGTFLQRLNYKTGLYFDLPTEIMHEIAARAGVTTTYIWGSDTTDGYEDYVSCTIDGMPGPAAVGSKLPNAWGLYDMCGLMNDFCLGATCSSRHPNAAYLGNLKTRPAGIFDPTYNTTANAIDALPTKGGGFRGNVISGSDFHASVRTYKKYTESSSAWFSYRISYIVK